MRSAILKRTAKVVALSPLLSQFIGDLDMCDADELGAVTDNDAGINLIFLIAKEYHCQYTLSALRCNLKRHQRPCHIGIHLSGSTMSAGWNRACSPVDVHPQRAPLIICLLHRYYY